MTQPMRTRADSPTKTCREPECGRALRARGLCSTHYNQQHQPGRHRSTPTNCTVCGAAIARPISADRRPVCSTVCRTIVTHGVHRGGSGYDWAFDAARRARQAGATVIDLFDREQVFERDDWTCGICWLPVDRAADTFHPNSATVDHVVPLSRGGQHTLANVQCAHLRCNSMKQDTLCIMMSDDA